jgi:cytochrome c oxidase subunit 4
VSEENHAPASYRSIVLTYLALLLLAALSVTLSTMSLGAGNVWAPLGIGVLQAALVVLYFMHLRKENWLWQLLFLIVVMSLEMFIGLTFVDVLYR